EAEAASRKPQAASRKPQARDSIGCRMKSRSNPVRTVSDRTLQSAAKSGVEIGRQEKTEEAGLLPFFVSTALGPAAPGARMRSPAQSRALSFGFANSCFMSADSG
ncbi:hypothetical protein, partial [Burkholderia pseudomallei]